MNPIIYTESLLGCGVSWSSPTNTAPIPGPQKAPSPWSRPCLLPS